MIGRDSSITYYIKLSTNRTLPLLNQSGIRILPFSVLSAIWKKQVQFHLTHFSFGSQCSWYERFRCSDWHQTMFGYGYCASVSVTHLNNPHNALRNKKWFINTPNKKNQLVAIYIVQRTCITLLYILLYIMISYNKLFGKYKMYYISGS